MNLKECNNINCTLCILTEKFKGIDCNLEKYIKEISGESRFYRYVTSNTMIYSKSKVEKMIWEILVDKVYDIRYM